MTFCIDHISTDSFYANAADLELRFLAFNQIVLFTKNVLNHHTPRHFCLDSEKKVADDTCKIKKVWESVSFKNFLIGILGDINGLHTEKILCILRWKMVLVFGNKRTQWEGYV